jgi:4-hydroxy-3-polyprenylbenzoate decarboxylase
MLSSSRQWFPKLAYVFDEDIDIFDDNRVKWALAWRFHPGKGTLIIPDLNVLPLDPIAGVDHPPVNLTKIGFDCTVPLIGVYDEFSFQPCKIMEPLGEPKADLRIMTEKELTEKMSDYIRQSPRTWRDLVTYFHGQPNPLIYKAFGNIRNKLGRMADRRPDYPYTFADTWFVHEKK